MTARELELAARAVTESVPHPPGERPESAAYAIAHVTGCDLREVEQLVRHALSVARDRNSRSPHPGHTEALMLDSLITGIELGVAAERARHAD